MKYSNCTYCPHHKVESDPDPNDWFNNDDVKVVCAKSFDRPITVACRPHHIDCLGRKFMDYDCEYKGKK